MLFYGASTACEVQEPTTKGQFRHWGHNMKYFGRGPLDVATCHI